VSDDDIEIFKNNFDQMIILLLNELGNVDMSDFNFDLKKFHIFSYVLNENLFEITFLWSLSYPEYLYELKNLQLKYYESVLNCLMMHKNCDKAINLLFYRQLNRPLLSLLNHCSKHKSTYIEKHMVVILNLLCVCICKNFELLNIFYVDLSSASLNSSNNRKILKEFQTLSLCSTPKGPINPPALSTKPNENGAARFLLFSLLIPYIHQEGHSGNFIFSFFFLKTCVLVFFLINITIFTKISSTQSCLKCTYLTCR
jgi:hypothetical protein